VGLRGGGVAGGGETSTTPGIMQLRNHVACHSLYSLFVQGMGATEGKVPRDSRCACHCVIGAGSPTPQHLLNQHVVTTTDKGSNKRTESRVGGVLIRPEVDHWGRLHLTSCWLTQVEPRLAALAGASSVCLLPAHSTRCAPDRETINAQLVFSMGPCIPPVCFLHLL
jgi:hypothetical protein